MSVFCISCGQENGDGASFCDHCGTSLRSGCPSCGTENRPEARFCRACGTRLLGASPEAVAAGAGGPVHRSGGVGTVSGHAAGPQAGVQGAAVLDATGRTTVAASAGAERRLVSVLFADLVAFTAFSEGRDPELVRDTLSRYFEAARTAIERHGGRVEKFIGDAVMAAWGAPRANEDDAERAVRAALEVVGAVRDLGEGLEARVAVLTGQAAVTLGAQDQGMVAGDLVNTAARLQGVAPPSTVLVGEATMQAASSAIAFEAAGEQLLKGRQAPVPAWRVLRVVSERGGRSRSEGLEPPFVGREVELRLLKDLLHAIGQERRPRLVSITGPAGIGKSRLAWEFEKYLDGLVEEVYWHRGRAPSYGEGVTFWALGEMVRKRAGLAEVDDEATTRARIHETVLEYVPEDADRAWVEPALLTLLGLEPAPAGGREVLFAAWRIFFERIAAQGTTVMLFEDLQWADGGQLDFIDHVMEWSKNVPLLVITLARPELLERRPGWGTSARSFNAIGLEPLTDDQMRELLLGLVPDLPEAAIAMVLARADGIPLYAVETVRMLIADGRLTAADDGTYRPSGELGELAMPDSLRALIASRLDALPPEDRGLLQDASVLGKTFSPEALSAISGEDAERLAPRLRSLVKRELLEVSEDPRAPERGHYGFVQSVIREVAYDTLSRRDRRSRHLAAARYFESLGDEELAGILSTHYLAAHQASDPGPEADALQVQARLALRGAADRALALGASDQAITCLRQALEITDAPGERGTLLERAALAADLEGRYAEAEAQGMEAIAAFEAAGDRTGVARVAALMGTILVDAGKLTEAVDFLESAIAKADRPEDDEARADMLARLSRAHMRLIQPERAVARADEALAIAEPRRLDHIIAEAFVNKGAALNAAGRLREPPILLEAAVKLAAATGDLALELRARNNLGASYALEDKTVAQAIAREAHELATRLGIAQMTQWLLGGIAYATLEEGTDLEGTLADLRAGIDAAKSDADRARLMAVQIFLRTWRGEDTQEAELERARYVGITSDPDEEVWALTTPATRDLLAGRFGPAIGSFRQASELPGQNVMEARLGMALASHWSRDLSAARDAERVMQGEAYSGRIVEGMQTIARAGVMALEGDPERALREYRQAVELLERHGFRFTASLARLDAIHLLSDEPVLAAWAEEARATFDTIGSPALVARLDDALVVSAVDPRQARPGVTAASTGP